MMRLRMFLILFVMLASGCGHHGMMSSSSHVYLDVFDCLIPVPQGYGFNTSDSSTTHAYTVHVTHGGRSWGELNVWQYDGPVPREIFEILESRTRGVLTIEEVRPFEPSAGDRERESLIIVTDGRRKLSLGGEAKALVNPMVDACLASMRE